ncbi:unnamed protein product [Blepharisma stoltei]|uniref:RING-type domain-containing protein n=1 Tax=Blepharisma stoltei TaxID=1481888 RepID=A0AAU9J5N4_9CILI|nr:unnamed protein product [Blepharisma stoltei]
MISEYHMTQYWCHSCRRPYLQNSSSDSFHCARCHSELVEEIQNDDHPRNFVPEFVTPNSEPQRPPLNFTTNTLRIIRQMPDGNIIITERAMPQPNFFFFEAPNPGIEIADFMNLLGQLNQGRQGPPPASEYIINSLPILKGSEVSGECSICQDSFKPNDQIRRMPCQHNFHNDCIVRWLRIRNNCPTCRSSVENPQNSTSSCI